jgi:predicted Rossmann fold flavoprotein
MYNSGMRIAIIGGGASGMAAALQAAGRGASVTLLERNSLLGRKLRVTGSGRCNITNDGVAAEKYACADPDWMASLLGSFGVQALRGLLEKIGIPLYRTPDGWYYPLSNSAQAVVDAFTAALTLAGVSIQYANQVNSILPGDDGIVLHQYSRDGKKEAGFDRVIVAAGGRAYPKLGSRGELFPVLERLGHTVIPKRPALAPVLADLGPWKALQGVRLDAGAGLWDGKDRLASAAGNLIFTEWGLNGPAVMDISHHISAREGRPLVLSLDLLHFFDTEFRELLAQKRKTRLPVKILLGAFFPPKVSSFYPPVNDISADTPLDQIDDHSLERLAGNLRGTRLPVKGVRGFEYCQLSAGGVPVSEADPRTLESRVVKGLYLTGETLDVVGPCGGYNLQFAFASGALAGMAASGPPPE